MRRAVPIALGFMLLTLTASILFGYAPVPVEAAPGDIIWAKSEPVGTHDQQANGAAVDATGVYVVGWDANLTSLYYEWRLEKRDLATGTPVWNFSEQISTPYGNDVANAVAVDGTGVYIVGYDSAVGHFEWRIEKRDLSTGSFITTFGTNGAISEHISNRDDVAYGVAVDRTGLYVVGYDENTSSNLWEWRIEKRNLSTGGLIWSVSEHISMAGDIASGVAVDRTGVYVVGYDNSSPLANPPVAEWRIEKRNLTTGVLISTFGVGGAISEHISAADDQANGIATDSTGLYVVGFDQNTAGNWDEWRIEKRDLSTGSFITTFGTNGVITEHISPYRDDANAVTVDSTGLYVVGKDENSPSYPEWRMEKRNLTTGGTIWATSEDISTNYPGNQAYGVAVDNTGVYVVGSDSAVGNGYAEWRVEKRVLGDQTLITGVSSGPGTVNPNCEGPAGCSEDVGAPISVTALPTPASGLSFLNWAVSGASCSGGAAANPCMFTMPNNAVTVSTTFGIQIALVPGWDLISLPIIPANAAIGTVLASQITDGSFTVIWSYQNGKWFGARLSGGVLTGMAPNPLTTIQDGYGYWIFMTRADTLSVVGNVFAASSATPPSYVLTAGWNLVGFKPEPTITTEPLSVYLSSISGSYDTNGVWVYSGGAWIRAGPSYTLQPGQAMWILMTAPVSLRP